MDQSVKDVVHEMTGASDAERIAFPDVIKALMGVGVERYHADLLAGTKVYYLPDGTYETTQGHAVDAVAQDFVAGGVEQAVRAIQRGEIGYGAFCARIAAAGCVGYFVSLAGARAVYYGRTIETYTERFPQKP